jgi:type IV pilus assembly protein PilY1
MNMESPHFTARTPLFRRLGNGLAAAALSLLVCSPAMSEVAQSPLYLGGGNVPGNLTLVPSVEWPTITSVANLGQYDVTRKYAGYFDSNKCYEYSYNSTEANRHFYPVSWTMNHQCVGLWSGNFMNWAATQTIDPFRSVLTGGYRVRDTASETWLEKARHTGQGGTNIYPNRRLPGSGNSIATVQGATPFAASWMRMRIEGLGNEMRFRLGNDDVNQNVTDYNPAVAVLTDRAYRLSVRVKVCVPGLLEANCRAYSGGYKPEGLIQQYADELRIGVFGYLNDHNMLRDGGVLRARQKFVGPTRIVPGQGAEPNPAMEWDPATGILIGNPDAADASATATALGIAINNSGAINYLNKFGQLTNNNHKSIDPVSELFYTALRYLKNQGNVPQYSAIPGGTGVNAVQAADGFPVITDWEDPIQYACQKNVILGIGDVYTHRDKNLPGSSFGADEPAMPAAVAGDTTVNVVTETNRVAALEGININHNPFSGRANSAFMAGLAWDANTRDIRPDLPGKQTVSTHWVDVLEAQSLEPPVRNQYYLATKYGGFRTPEDFDPDTHTGALPLDWWHSNGETLVSFGPQANPTGVSFPRPDNYYVAGEADQMVESLTEAFARISAELRSSASSVAANSTRLGADTAVFQASFDSTNWSGELQAFRINEDGTISVNPSWSAAEKLDARTEAAINVRKIFTVTPPVRRRWRLVAVDLGHRLHLAWACRSTARRPASVSGRWPPR